MLVPALVALIPAAPPQEALDARPPVARRGGPYTLFNPVPRDEMRPYVTDRPNVTDAAVTVDAGHAQFEISFADWTREVDDDVFVAAQSNVKVGLTHSTDLQLVLDSFVVADDGAGGTEEGIGDLQVRFKWNLWGNDGEPSAFALLPFVKLPTAADGLGNDEVEGGLALPYSTALSDTVGLGVLARFDAAYDAEDDRHELRFVHSAVLSFAHTPATSTYVEYAGIAGGDDYLPFLNAGVFHLATADLSFDAGVRLGLVEEAPDLGVFAGVGARL